MHTVCHAFLENVPTILTVIVPETINAFLRIRIPPYTVIPFVIFDKDASVELTFDSVTTSLISSQLEP